MDSTEQIDNEFSRIAALPDTRINLAEGALLIARAAYPNLEESLYLNQLDRIASRVKRDMAAELDAAGKIARINHVLYESMGNPDRAVKDWERYLACVGDHESVSKVRARIEGLKQQPSRIH